MVAGHARRVAARLSSETPAGHGQNSRDPAEGASIVLRVDTYPV